MAEPVHPLDPTSEPTRAGAVAGGCDFVMHTHPGMVRPLNEDAIGAAPSAGLYILADGLGGYNAGEIASTMAVSTLLEELAAVYERGRSGQAPFDPARVLRETLIRMNASIYRAALHSSAFEGMATTIVVAWVIGDTLWVAHAGDSRLYRYRDGQLEQLTRDHSFSQELLDAGMVTEEEARLLPAKNLVTRALGAATDVEPEVNLFDLEAGDLLLLCSDGLTEMITPYEMDGLLSLHEDGLDVVARHLVDMANEAGGRDNISVVLIRVGEIDSTQRAQQTTTQSSAEPGTPGAGPARPAVGGEDPDTLLPPDSGIYLRQWYDPDYSSDFHVQSVL